jgi:KEOPS complex subunit Cgi121
MRLVTGTPTGSVEALLGALDGVTTGGVTAQAFDARYVADRAHLERAVALADRERSRGEGIADSRAMEILLYAAGRRQIDRALAMGARGGEPAALVVAGGDGTPSAAEERVAEAVASLDAVDPHSVDLGDPATLREFFEVGDAELAAAGDLAGLVRERVALLVVER